MRRPTRLLVCALLLGCGITEPRGLFGHYVLTSVDGASLPHRLYTTPTGEYETIVSSTLDLRAGGTATLARVFELKDVHTLPQTIPIDEEYAFTVRGDSLFFFEAVTPRPSSPTFAMRLTGGRLELTFTLTPPLGGGGARLVTYSYER